MIWSVFWESGCVLWGVYTIRSILDHGDTNILFSSRVVKIKGNSNRKFNPSLHRRISDNQTNAGGSPWELPSLRGARILTTGWRLPIKLLDHDVNKKKYPETCARHDRDSTLFKDHSASTPQHGGCGLAHATWGLQSAGLHPYFIPALGDFLQIFTKHVAYRTLKGFRGKKIPQFSTSEGLLTSKSEEMSPFYLWKCQEPLHILTTVPSNPQQRRTITASVARGWLLIS